MVASFCASAPGQSAASVIRPLPPHFLQGAGYILWPGFGGCSTGGKPVPLQASQSVSAVLLICRLIARPSLAYPPARCRGQSTGLRVPPLSRYGDRTPTVQTGHADGSKCARAGCAVLPARSCQARATRNHCSRSSNSVALTALFSAACASPSQSKALLILQGSQTIASALRNRPPYKYGDCCKATRISPWRPRRWRLPWLSQSRGRSPGRTAPSHRTRDHTGRSAR